MILICFRSPSSPSSRAVLPLLPVCTFFVAVFSFSLCGTKTAGGVMRVMFPNRALSSRRHFRPKIRNFRVHRFSSRLAATGNHNRTNWRRKEEYLYRQKVLCEDGKEVGVSKAQFPSQVPTMLRRRTIRHGSAGSAFLTETQKGGGKKLKRYKRFNVFFLVKPSAIRALFIIGLATFE